MDREYLSFAVKDEYVLYEADMYRERQCVVKRGICTVKGDYIMDYVCVPIRRVMEALG